jgi:hypothetical protein
MAIASTTSLVDALRQCRLLEAAQLEEVARTLQARFPDPKSLARELMQRGWLTPYQANQLLQGKGGTAQQNSASFEREGGATWAIGHGL